MVLSSNLICIPAVFLQVLYIFYIPVVLFVCFIIVTCLPAAFLLDLQYSVFFILGCVVFTYEYVRTSNIPTVFLCKYG